MTTISVALCTYGSERFLEEQLDSIAGQSRLPDELVISDDGSTDRTLEIAERFRTRARFPVRISRTPARLGVTKNFERAISLCGGDLIFLSDHDDVWYPHKIRALSAAMAASDRVGAAFSDADVVDEALVPRGYRVWEAYDFPPRYQRRLAAGRALEVLLRHNVVSGATVAFRSSLRDLVLPIPAEWVHDRWIPLLIAAAATVAAVPEALVAYRQHPGQESGAERKSFAARSAEARRTGVAAYATLADRYEEARRRLMERTEAFPVSVRAFGLLEAKIRHLRARARIRAGARTGSLARELVAGNYHRFSRGWRSAAADALH